MTDTQDRSPSADDDPIVDALRAIIRGGGCSLDALGEAHALHELRCVRNTCDGPPDRLGLADAAGRIIREAIAGLDDGMVRDSAEDLLAVNGTLGVALTERRGECAKRYHVTVETFRKRKEPALVREIAQRIHLLERRAGD